MIKLKLMETSQPNIVNDKSGLFLLTKINIKHNLEFGFSNMGRKHGPSLTETTTCNANPEPNATHQKINEARLMGGFTLSELIA